MGSSEFGEDSFGTGKPGYASFEPGHHSLEEFVDDLVYGECYATFPEDGCCDGHSLSHGRAGVLGVPFNPMHAGDFALCGKPVRLGIDKGAAHIPKDCLEVTAASSGHGRVRSVESPAIRGRAQVFL